MGDLAVKFETVLFALAFIVLGLISIPERNGDQRAEQFAAAKQPLPHAPETAINTPRSELQETDPEDDETADQ